MSATFAAKTVLRKSLLNKLRAVPDQELSRQSEAVFRILRTQPFYRDARAVGCYLSMNKGELQTRQMVDDLLQRDTKLYTPYLPPTSAPVPATLPAGPVARTSASASEMHMLRLYSPADLGACPLDRWGILDPGENRRDTDEKRQDALDPDAPDLDVILIPGVGFDEECNRLGRGKAYYDRYLARYTSQRKRPLLVALALQCQLLPSDQRVPVTPDDFTLDGVITPDRVIWRDGAPQ